MTRTLIAMVMVMSPLSSAPAIAGPPTPVSNSIPYRVTTPVANGRDGTAMLVSRALMARDGSTTLEIATAPFGEVPQDAITHILFKAFAPSGGVLFTRTSNDILPNGSLLWTFDSLGLGVPLEVEAHVDDRLLPRTDVVVVDDVVRRRPDLRVLAIRAPAQAIANVPVAITATVDEHNGDVGAHANCVLYVDGAEADRIDGMWVDAGDSVSCAFTQVFDAEGHHALRVVVTDVDPADWDSSNNALDASVLVVGPFQQYYVFATERTEDQWSLKQSWIVYGNSSPAVGDDYVSQRSLSEWSQGIGMYGTVPHRWSFPLTAIDVTASDETGVRLSTHLTNIAATNVSSGPDYDVACGSIRTGGNSNVRYAFVFVCSRHDYAGDWSFLDFSQADGSVNYMSTAYDRFWSGDPSNVTGYRYWDNTVITDGGGTLVPFGSAVQFDLALTSGDIVDGVDVTIPMGAATTQHDDQPLFCDAYSSGGYSSRFCVESHDTITFRSGLVTVGMP